MQRTMGRREFLRLAGLASTAALVAACQPAVKPTVSEPTAAQPAAEKEVAASPKAPTVTKVSIQTAWFAQEEPGRDYWQRAIAAFEEKPENADLDIELINVGTTPQDMLASIAGGTAPDIYHTYGGTTGSFEPEDLAPRGVAVALDDFIETAKYFKKDWYLPVYWEAKMWDGKIWALPVTEGGPGGTASTIHVRMLEEAGLDSTRGPETWEEYVDWAIKLTKYDADGNIDVAGSDPLDSVGYSWHFWARHFDTNAISEDKTKITFDNENWVKALNVIATVWQELGVEKMEAHKLAWGYWTGHKSGFPNGKRAIIFNGYWQPGEFTSVLADQSWVILYDWPPSINVGEKVAAMGGTHSLWMTSNCKQREQAFRFMDFMCGVEANLINYELRGGFVWNTELDKVLDVGRYKGLDWFMAVPQTADRIVSPLQTSSAIGAEITNGWNRIKEEVIYGQKTAAEALNDITMELQKSLDEALKARA